jgi:hypothetical protein
MKGKQTVNNCNINQISEPSANDKVTPKFKVGQIVMRGPVDYKVEHIVCTEKGTFCVIIDADENPYLINEEEINKPQ